MKYALFILTLFLTACSGGAQPAWKSQGPEFTPSKNEAEVFYDESKIERPFAYMGVAQTKEGNEASFIKASKKTASQKGADGLVFAKENDVMKAYIFKYLDNLTEDDQQLIRNFAALNYYRD